MKLYVGVMDIILTAPFFFEKRDWIPLPEDWRPGIQQGKRYDTLERAGADLWQQVQERMETSPRLSDDAKSYVGEEKPRYGSEYLTRMRLGQGAFRALVTEAYHRQCAMTGERTWPALVAAHIKPYGKSGPHRVDNGLLLRADLHLLFDKGFITLAKDYRIEVSRRIKEEFDNGEEYYAMHGQPLSVLPAREIERPSLEFIEWHNEQVFSP